MYASTAEAVLLAAPYLPSRRSHVWISSWPVESHGNSEPYLKLPSVRVQVRVRVRPTGTPSRTLGRETGGTAVGVR